VRHVDDRDAQLVAARVQVGQDAPAERDVHGGQRLVEQEQRRAGHQRAAERDALAFAAGEIGDAAIEQLSISSMPTTRSRSGEAPGCRP
jgi:hypothetical protein